METASPEGSAGRSRPSGQRSKWQSAFGCRTHARDGGDTGAWLPAGRERGAPGAQGSLSSGAAVRFAEISKLNAEDSALLCVYASIKS